MTKKDVDAISRNIIGAAIEVHKALGPGLMEGMYHKAMKRELTIRNTKFETELKIDLEYKGEIISSGLRCDLLVDDTVVVELKAVEGLIPVHEAQLITYMKLLKKPKGVLINFHCRHIFSEGQKTYVNEYYKGLDAA